MSRDWEGKILMTKKKRKKSLSVLKKQLWNIFSRYVRLRDAVRTTGSSENVRCITCGKIKHIKEVDAGHFISRAHASGFVYENNVHAQCVYCNKQRHGEQYIYSLKIKQLYGQEELDKIAKLRYETKIYSTNDIEELKLVYKKKLKELTDLYGNPWE